MVALALITDVPDEERAEFAALPQAARDEYHRWRDALLPVLEARRGGVGGAIARAAHRLGERPKTVRGRLDRWRKGGFRWMDLIDGRSLRRDCSLVPPGVVRWIAAEAAGNQRKTAPAIRRFCALWAARDPRIAAVPGLEDFPNWPELPPGCSPRNLARIAPAPEDLAIPRRGRQAAKLYLPQRITTRVGLRVGQFYAIDDQEHDVKIVMPGVQRKHLRPLSLDASDLLTGCCFAHLHKPALYDEIEEAKKKIRKRDTVWLVAMILTSHGYRSDEAGTTIITEAGTGALPAAFKRRLADALGVRVDEGRSDRRAALPGQLRGPARGNPRHKALHESIYNLLRNECGDIAGQTGMNPDMAPEDGEARDRETRALLLASSVLPPDRAALLRFGYLTWDQWLVVIEERWRRLNAITEHSLEGWEKLGFVREEFRLGDGEPWRAVSSIGALPPAGQEAIAAALRGAPSLLRSRRMSRGEAWDSRRHELTALPHWRLGEILPEDFAVERTLSDRRWFEFEDADLGPGDHVYEGRITTPEGRPELLRRGERYNVFANPLDPQNLLVCDGRFRVLGVAPRVERACRCDAEAAQRAHRRVSRDFAEAAAPFVEAGAKRARAETERLRHNAGVLDLSRPKTEAERRIAERVKGVTAADIDDLISPGPDGQPIADSEPGETPQPGCPGETISGTPAPGAGATAATTSEEDLIDSLL